MKVSREQKEQNRQRIIRAATELITEKGVKAATMQKISRLAALGDATIYNYFPTKNAILLAYYGDRLEDCIERLQVIEGFDEYTLSEKLQSFMETSFDLYLADREFVAQSFKTVFLSFSLDRKPLQPLQGRFSEVLHEFFRTAEETGEIPGMVFKDVLYQLFWEYYLGMVLYWLKDQSEQFNQTSQLLDQSLGLIYAVLQAGVFNKLFDLVTFLFRNHVLSRLDLLTRPAEAVHILKNMLREGADE